MKKKRNSIKVFIEVKISAKLFRQRRPQPFSRFARSKGREKKKSFHFHYLRTLAEWLKGSGVEESVKE